MPPPQSSRSALGVGDRVVCALLLGAGLAAIVALVPVSAVVALSASTANRGNDSLLFTTAVLIVAFAVSVPRLGRAVLGKAVAAPGRLRTGALVAVGASSLLAVFLFFGWTTRLWEVVVTAIFAAATLALAGGLATIARAIRANA